MAGSVSSDGDRKRPIRRKSRVERLQDDEDDPLPAEGEEGPQVRVRDVFGGWFHGRPEHASVSVDVEHYIHDKSFRHRLILLSLRNSKIGIRLQGLRFLLALAGCLLYVAEAFYFDFCDEECKRVHNSTANSPENPILKDVLTLLLLNNKPWSLWALQVVVGVLCMTHAFFVLYTLSGVSMKAVSWRLLDVSVSISLTIGGLFLITVLYPVVLKDLFVPSFLLVWPARQAFSIAFVQYMQRKITRLPNTFRHKTIHLFLFLSAFIFTWVCLLHHIERIDQRISLFDTFWFVLVTLSTVGYGDISPTLWTGKLLVMVFIVAALIYLIPQIQELFDAFQMQQKLHNTVSYQKSGKHIIVCARRMKPLVLRDFLTEFYSDPTHYELHCVVLVEEELSSILQVHLSHPIWDRRITVVIGSPLRATDLARVSFLANRSLALVVFYKRAESATACFLHTARDEPDQERADQHTIMSAWALKDYAPDCKLHVQILKSENKLHLDIADHVVCEGELKHALLANHSHCPGITTLVTLLLHTFKPEERDLTSEDYKLYNQCAPCEVYDSQLQDSKYFHHFVGKNFLYTAVVAFRKYHVTLLGVRGAHDQHMRFNPGLDHVMHEEDTVYYIGFTKEEYSKVGRASHVHTALWEMCANAAMVSLAVGGVDPMKLDEHNEAQHVAKNGHNVMDGLGRDEVDFQPPRSPVERVKFFIPERDISQTSLASHANHTGTAAVEPQTDNWQNEARRGLQLLRFHSHMDLHANPVVRVNLLNQQPTLSDKEICPFPEEDATDTCSTNGELEHMTFTPGKLEERRRAAVPIHLPLMRYTSVPVEADKEGRKRPTYMHQRSFSDTIITEEDEKGVDSSLKKVGIYSSDLSLIPSSPRMKSMATGSAGGLHLPSVEKIFHPSFLRRVSRQSSNSDKQQQLEEEVVLELNNIEEEEELEELEDGRCPEAGRDLDPSSPPVPSDGPIHSCPRPRYEKGVLPVSPYCGCEALECHLLPARRSYSQIRLDMGGDDKEDAEKHWYEKAVIAYHDEASDDLHHFVLPLRAHHLPPRALKPIVLMLGTEPCLDFLDTIAWLPMVYFCVGSVSCVNDWLRAGILLADSVVVLSPTPTHPHPHPHPHPHLPVHPTPHPDHKEHMDDAAHIMAVRKLSKLFPSVNIITELHYRYNIRFMQFTACETYMMRNLSPLRRRGDHLTYLFVPQFAAGRAFCSSMLDTLLYQAHVKPYIIDLVRELLGCKQSPGSAFLWKVEVTEELLKLQTYERLFQRLVSTQRLVPIGIYRTIPTTACPEIQKFYSETYYKDPENVSRFLKSRLHTLGLKDESPTTSTSSYGQSFVLPNPSPKTELKPNDVILVLKPAPTQPPSAPPPSKLPPPSKAPSFGGNGSPAVAVTIESCL